MSYIKYKTILSPKSTLRQKSSLYIYSTFPEKPFPPDVKTPDSLTLDSNWNSHAADRRQSTRHCRRRRDRVQSHARVDIYVCAPAGPRPG